jgi:predicted DNA-binding WGR domain protein
MNYYLTCINPEQNKHRFYSMTVQDGLFGNFYLVRHWGRIGTKGRYLSQGFDTLDEVENQIDRLLRIRKRHGYCLKTSIEDKMG